MSAQTGISSPSGPVSSRAIDRARFRVDRLRNEPNPVWIRELKQAARLGRTPIFMAVLTILLTLIVAAIGGLVSTEYSPATTGIVLFQVFFSIAWFVVTLVGPAVAANSIAAEREGHTWEAVVLTGLSPARIARGKFLAAFTSIGAYVVALAPVGALSFLFGGVTATEVVVAFAVLFLVALLSVAFGLAISSKMDRSRGAILATTFLSFVISLLSFLFFGVTLSLAAHQVWPGVADGPPVWLPSAYERAHFDVLYVVCLVVMPLVLVTLPAWFLYEVTIANLTSVTDDRSSRLKRWFLVATPILVIATAVPPFLAAAKDRIDFVVGGASWLVVFFTFCVLLFQGEPIGPSRRVLMQWDRAGASRIQRFLGPGVIRAGSLLLAVALGGLLVQLAAGAVAIWLGSTAGPMSVGFRHPLEELAAFGGYALGFGIFAIGLAALLRARIATPLTARVVGSAIVFGITTGPWIAAAIAGVMTSSVSSSAMSVAGPSPFFAYLLMASLRKGDADVALPVGIACAATFAVLGLVFFGAAQRRCSRIIRQHEAMLLETDRILAAEDEAMAAPPPDDSSAAEPAPAV